MPEITLQTAYEQGSLRVVFECWRLGVRLGDAHCGQRSTLDIGLAISHFGKDRRLDQIRARCTRCGSADFVKVSCEPMGRAGRRGRR